MNSTAISPSERVSATGEGDRSNSGTWLIWSLLVASLCLCIFVRVRLLSLPLERDEGEYAYGAQLLLEHRGLLYRDIHSLKWPGMFGMYALGFFMGGASAVEIHAQLLVLNLLSAGGMFLLACELVHRREALFAVTIFLVLSVLPCIQGFIANAEHFVNFFAIFGWWLLLRGLRNQRGSNLFAAGLLLGVSVCMKQHAVFGVAAGVLIAAWPAENSIAGHKRRLLHRASVFSLGVATAIAAMFLSIWAHGAWNEFWKWTMVYSREYTTQVSFSDAPILLEYQLGRILPVILPASFLALLGLIWSWRKRSQPALLAVIAILVAGFLGTTPGFYFREHYFLLMVPAVSLLAALGVEAMTSAAQGARVLPAVGLFLVLTVLWPLGKQWDLLVTKTVRQVSRALYGMNPFVESPRIAEYLQRHMDSQESFVIFGSEPQIAFYADRKLASGYIYMYPLMELHPLALSMQQEFIREVTQAQPAYAVMVDVRTSWLVRPNSESLVLKWIPEFLEGYELCGRVSIQPSGYSEDEFTEGVLPAGLAAAAPRASDTVLVYRRKR
jgi:4-amino-4-deoxy-L-arabinose transferase-like glycosyltransferase